MPTWICRLFPRLCPAAPVSPMPIPPTAGIDAQWLALLNGYRAASGVPPMETDARLSDMAQSWATQMAMSGVLGHDNFAGRLVAAVGAVAGWEDVAEGQPEVYGVSAAWMSSVPHKAAMLGPGNRTGIGRSVSASGVVFWSADFATE